MGCCQGVPLQVDPQSASEIPSAQSSKAGVHHDLTVTIKGNETHTQMSLPHLPWKEKLQPPLPYTPTQSTLVCWPIPCVLEVLLTILATCTVGGQSEDPHPAPRVTSATKLAVWKPNVNYHFFVILIKDSKFLAKPCTTIEDLLPQIYCLLEQTNHTHYNPPSC